MIIKYQWRHIIPAAVIIIAAGVFFLFRESEKDKIIAKIRELAEVISKPAGEAPAAGLMRLAAVDDIFVPHPEIELRQEKFCDMMPIQELTGRIAACHRQIIEGTAAVSDPYFTYITGEKAELCFTGTLKAKLNSGRISEVREVQAVLLKTPAGWRIDRLVIRPVLER